MVRPDLKVLADPEIAIIKIQEVVPKEAVLTNYYFDGETGEVQSRRRSRALSSAAMGQLFAR